MDKPILKTSTPKNTESITSSTTSIVIIIAIVFIILIILLFINNRNSKLAPNCVLESPKNVYALSDEKSTIVVGWDRVKGATEYKVLRSCHPMHDSP